MDHQSWNKGIIAWFAQNPVAANLLMIVLLLAGLVSATLVVKKEIQPKLEINTVTVSVPYLGAAPEEVEQGVILRIEEAVQDLEGVTEIDSRAQEGVGIVNIEVDTDFDIDVVMDQIKNRVDAISTFPLNTEKPVISRATMQQAVMIVSIFGDRDERFMKEYANQIRDEITAMPQVSVANILGSRDYEVSVEIPEQTLQAYGLSLGQVANAIRASSLDLPGGSIKSDKGDILLRTTGQAYSGEDFEKLVLITRPDGTRVTLGDIALVDDGFVERPRFAMFDGKPSFGIQVMSVGDQSELEISRVVNAYVDAKQQQLPTGVRMAVWADISTYLQERLSMMNENILLGAFLVFVLLSFLLRIKLAFWVMVGIPVAFLGTLWVMPLAGVSINMLSLFGFILVLGIVVDDAIIIGESAYTEIRASGHSTKNVVIGAQRVAMPATFGVLTTVVAFMPLLFVGGVAAPFWASIGVVVIACLIFSIVESKWILPAHLSHMRLKPIPENKRGRFIRVQRAVSNGMERFVERYYQPMLDYTLKHRLITMTSFAAVFVLALGLVLGGVVRSVFFPNLLADFIQVDLQMAQGTPSEKTEQTITQVADKLYAIDAEVSAAHGEQSGAVVRHSLAWTQDERTARMVVELVKDQFAVIPAPELVEQWRDRVGDIPGATQFSISGATGTGGGAPIAFQLVGTEFDELQAAADELKKALSEYDGVFDIRSSYDAGISEVKLGIKPEAEVLGLTLENLATQVRHAFYGAEAQRVQRGREDVRVMVRYPDEDRTTVNDLQRLQIRTPTGQEVPFSAVAEVEQGIGYSSITRVDRRRSITVSADANLDAVEPGEIVAEVSQKTLPRILQNHPGVRSELTGASEEELETMQTLLLGAMLAMFAIYALMAIPLRSYAQPLIIMTVIPFGIIGAIVGHWLLGIPVSMLSFFGIIALAGVVVNDSLIMVDFINKERAEGIPLIAAVRQAGAKRFRAIILTSLTTFVGLLPILLEKSLQAQILIPMATSLAFGILFATIMTLFLIPTLYMLLDDIKAFYRGERMYQREQRLQQESGFR